MHCISFLFVGSALLANVTSAQSTAQIPPSFSPSSTTQLLESFQNNTVQITPGQQIGINVPASPPALGLTNINATTTPYVLIMVDPDPPYPSNPYLAQILHWLQPNLRPNSTSPFLHTLSASSPALVPYERPRPPTNSTAHRYIQYLFVQPAGFKIPAAFAGYSETNRTNFNITNFISAAGLSTPVAANYFLVSNQTISANNGTGGNSTSTSRPATFTSGASALGPAYYLWTSAAVLSVLAVGSVFAI